jgi:hypothetical protein
MAPAVPLQPGFLPQDRNGCVPVTPSTWPLPARRSPRSTSPTPSTLSAAVQANGTPAWIARSIMPAASRGLVAKRTSSGT